MSLVAQLLNGYVLRPFEMADASSLAQHANDVEIAARLRDGFPSPYCEDDARWFIENIALADPIMNFAIADPSGSAVGGIGLALGSDIHARTAELGYWLGRAHWGRGVVSAAVREVASIGFESLGLMRIHAEPLLPHPASERVLQKAGFKRESVKRRSAVKNGVACDQAVWVLLDTDWSGAGEDSADAARC